MPFVEHADARIYYEVWGPSDAPALVFAHGAGGNTLSWWQQIPHFSKRYRVLAFDHRLFGRSRCTTGNFLPQHFPADLAAILDVEKIDKAALVGQSMGGWSVLPATLRQAERVSCLVLAGTPAGVFTDAVAANAMRIFALSEQSGIRSNEALAADFPAREPEAAHLYDCINALNENFDPQLLARLGDPELRLSASDFSAYRTPTLMLVGDRDALFPPEVLREVASIIPGTRFREIPGAGHSTYFETPQAFNTAVDEFLAEHWPAEH